MHPPGIGQINIAPLRGLLRCAHSGRRELNRFCTYVKLIDGHSSRLSVQISRCTSLREGSTGDQRNCLSMRLGHASRPQDRDQEAVPFVRLRAGQHRAPSRRRYEMRWLPIARINLLTLCPDSCHEIIGLSLSATGRTQAYFIAAMR